MIEPSPGLRDWLSLQNHALRLLTALTLDSLEEGSSGGSFEDFTDTLVGAGRALQVLVGANLLADFLTLARGLVK
jgi:hypothetical protein